MLRAILSIAIACVISLMGGILPPEALALIPIKLSQLDYHDCPPEIGAGAVTSDGSGRAANCFLITGKAQNDSGKTVYDADVFGRIYDANHNAILENRTRVGGIEELPPGISNFEIRISVPVNQPTPLELKQFKASGFTGTIRR